MPTDIEHGAPRIVLFTEAEAKQAYEDGMDLLEEVRQLAESRSAMYQQQLRNYHRLDTPAVVVAELLLIYC